ncbi:MAG: hypothetical protein A3I07_04460 [Candidatus Doudnabacteria bacterium RIFCSPLOWO2_02_FULL_42_9]|uniref:Phosphoribosylformylglycinamidine synthase, purS protein n=1 Tax=Candidatus Doudnabacteria bacterium RIFCSPHIGHO2_01_FULL_41_86 TaxID=1817821 RepID=A0A1F5N9Q7_9BACT|nr:MAG: hypothetical protein A2717_02030 [Candidatus Doudnabacteria bacterium RIFCSPHIGHO2_01_FULL_41_86]OGE75072.1 MAG: hypothetical protein A3K07_03780 [Candidatus Doudnabacteria bacterium RIFCSPHIGHO2_01_43_10]OGE85342.1 MAG: hypothetical protein A3E28_01600 [Candidatus Doudnabacteria bacterium RIFCSPHIGHO2_12_FULL_42_22]OGE86880.1 MAG: hypothetical protein A3C49_02435 [Candidatus Doudnabacteria bacterium RIFCSPHIGHO2_02_FULL_42_25]OGE92479.1 MAG: hypothetical protein A2895_02590 [Candidatus
MRINAQKFAKVRVEILVKHKGHIPNPEGAAKKEQLCDLGLPVTSVTTGKYFQVDLENVTLRQAKGRAPVLARKLLANPVYEEFIIQRIEPL